jgi:transposase
MQNVPKDILELKKTRAKRAKKPKHSMVARSYKFPLVVSKQESNKLFKVLGLCFELRNMLVQDRIDNRTANKLLKTEEKFSEVNYLTQSDQYKSVSLYAKQDKRFNMLHSQVCQNIAVRINEGYQRFFDSIKDGNFRAKPPKIIKSKNYKSFTFPQYGSSAKIKNGKVHLSGVGEFHLRDHRKIKGLKKTVTIKFQHGRWWVIVVAMVQEKDITSSIAQIAHKRDTGADPGLTHLFADSHGEVYDPPRALKNALKELKHEQRILSRKFESRKTAFKLYKNSLPKGTVAEIKDFPYSNRLKQQIKRVAILHTRVFNVRDYHHKKIASIIENRYRNVAVEEHGLQFMIKNRRLAKSASDRAIGKQKQVLASKLGSKRYVAVPNKRQGIGGNSQTCVCGASVPKELKDRIHNCFNCGLIADRDHVSANIVQLIAFNSISETLYEGHPGGMSVGVEVVKQLAVKAVVASGNTSERPLKRQLLASPKKRNTIDGKPAVEGKTCIIIDKGCIGPPLGHEPKSSINTK